MLSNFCIYESSLLHFSILFELWFFFAYYGPPSYPLWYSKSEGWYGWSDPITKIAAIITHPHDSHTPIPPPHLTPSPCSYLHWFSAFRSLLLHTPLSPSGPPSTCHTSHLHTRGQTISILSPPPETSLPFLFSLLHHCLPIHIEKLRGHDTTFNSEIPTFTPFNCYAS